MSLPENSQDVLSYTHGRTTAVSRRSLLDRSCDSPPAASARKGTGSRSSRKVEQISRPECQLPSVMKHASEKYSSLL